MIKPTIINISGQPNGILDLKKGFDKALKNIPVVGEDLLRIAWKCKQERDITENPYTYLFPVLLQNK